MERLSFLMTKTFLTVKLPLCFSQRWCFRTKKFSDETLSSARFHLKRRVYNCRHRAQRISENLFWILANWWRIFLPLLIVNRKMLRTSFLLHLYWITCLSRFSTQYLFLIVFWKMAEVSEGEWQTNVATDYFTRYKFHERAKTHLLTQNQSEKSSWTILQMTGQ